MNQLPTFDRKSLLLSMLFMVLIVMIAGGMAVYVMSDEGVKDALMLTAAAVKIEGLYRDDVDWQEMVKAGRRAIFDRLDRYSAYFQKEQFESMDEELEGSYTGIGVSIVFHEEGLVIMSVRENGPAATVGLLSGDIIIGVDSVMLRDLDPEKTVRLLRGEEGTEVRLNVYRPVTDELFEVVVTRQRIPFMHIPFAGFTPDSFIYIRLLDFDAGATDDLRSALDSLLADKDVKPKGLILDLRGNPGGLFAEAYRTADLFLDAGVFMVGTDGRSRWNDQEYYATGSDLTRGLPLAVIVDRGTASSAEIVAGALQTSHRAFLVGDTTFGKGLVQGFVRFPDGDGLKLTISRYYFEGPVYLNDFDSTLSDTGHGLVPDYYYDISRMHPVRREIENSLLLSEFASRYQEEIIRTRSSASAADSLTARFIAFAREHGFSFTSPRTVLADEMKALAIDEHGSPELIRCIEDLTSKFRIDDESAIDAEESYIKQRLLQIAYEREHGTYLTYRDVLINSRPEIAYASRILLEGK
jgi:C-terminal peptidase prc